MAKHYPSDITDEQWELVKAYFDPPKLNGGRPRLHTPRELVNAILYVTREGITWRAMPGDLPPWQTVVTARRRWIIAGTLERAFSALARA